MYKKFQNYYQKADAIRNQKASMPMNKLLPMNGLNKVSDVLRFTVLIYADIHCRPNIFYYGWIQLANV